MLKKTNRLNFLSGGRNLTIVSALAALMISLQPNCDLNAQTINPTRYYTFNGANAGTDSMGVYNLNFTTYNSPYTHESGGLVGKFLTLNSSSGLIEGGSVTLNTQVSVEFLFKPGQYFNSSILVHRGDAFAVYMEYGKITFTTRNKNSSGATIVDDFAINLDGIGRKSYGYYVDNNWHHMVFRYDVVTGVKTVWVDGQSPTGFSKTIAGGVSFGAATNTLFINSTVSYIKYYGSIDELAVYNTVIPDAFIYKHYLGVQTGQPYSFTNNYTGTIPAAAAVTAGIDPSEFAPGHPNVTVSATNQVLTFPGPRYKTGHTLLPNIPLYGIEYLGGLLQPNTTYSQALTQAKVQQVDLINNFNQSILVTSNTHEYALYSDTTKFGGWFIKYANQNPSKHASAFTFWPAVNPSLIGRNTTQPYITCNCLSANHYLRNSAGTFLDVYGNANNYKTISPAAPVDSLAYDGLTQRFYLTQLVAKLTRPVNLLFDNGEVIPFFNNSSILSQDPIVLADKNNSGLDWYTYEGRRAKEKVLAYRNQFMTLPQLTNTTFVFYGVDGQPNWRFKYSEKRLASTPINGQIYPSGDIYMRYPSNWRYWMSSWHGWQWVAESRKVELESGDKLFSPTVSPGWDVDEEQNVRPAQWLGMLKTFSMAGAEFFYPSFFSTVAPYQDSKNWAWQVVMTSYAQAVTSRYEDLLRNGYLMEGDVPNDYINPTWNAFSFKAGDLRKLVVIRKHNTLAKYAITGTLQPNNNMIGSAENSGIAIITLDGQTVKFKVRRQGSTYIYDKTNASAPVFYQLDEWHEPSHPYYWTKDFVFEAELFDNTNSNVVIKTTVPAGTPAGDYSNYTSAVTFTAASDVIYNFLPRLGAPTTQYLWVRARSKDGSTTGFTARLNGGNANTFDCIKDTNWVWYRFNTSNVAVAFSGLTATNQELKITATNTKLEIDRIHLTANSGAIYTGVPNPCSTAQATISANGPTSFCQGGSVVLSASNGTSYLWSNGATTQSITVSASGNYTVTVTTSGVGSSISTPASVTVFTPPSATVTAGGATTFCAGGSVTLTSSAGSSYLWSPGNQTSQSISVSSAGTYNVRVTDANGCTKVSSNTTVTVNALPTATITPGSTTTFCQGGSVTLLASSGSSYLWSPGNQTSQSISVSSGGTYNVRVTNSSGCSQVSSNTTVTVNSLPTATITPSGSLNLTSGQSVTLTSSSGSAYLWSPGNQTSQSISVNTAGSYTVRVTNSSGCSATSAAAVVTVGGAPSATITASGPTSFCSGGSVSLTASTGNSYLWSTGATTKSITATSSGSYTVTVTTNGVPAVSSPTVVTVYSLPTATITAGGPTSFCSGGSVTLTASSGSSYLWSPGNQTSQSITVSSGGTYNVRVTNSNGCSSTSSNTSVTVTTCSGTCDAPTGLTTVNVTSSSATVKWTNPNSGQTNFQVKLKDMLTYYTYSAGIVPSTTTQITVGANASRTYRWWVRSWCGSTTSSYAGYLTYTTSAVRETAEIDATDEVEITPVYQDNEPFDEGTAITLREDEVTIFPNPAGSESAISFTSVIDESYTLSIMDANGKVVSTEQIKAMEGFNIYAFDVSQLRRGIYFVQLTGSTTTVVKRLAVQ